MVRFFTLSALLLSAGGLWAPGGGAAAAASGGAAARASGERTGPEAAHTFQARATEALQHFDQDDKFRAFLKARLGANDRRLDGFQRYVREKIKWTDDPVSVEQSFASVLQHIARGVSWEGAFDRDHVKYLILPKYVYGVERSVWLPLKEQIVRTARRILTESDSGEAVLSPAAFDDLMHRWKEGADGFKRSFNGALIDTYKSLGPAYGYTARRGEDTALHPRHSFRPQYSFPAFAADQGEEIARIDALDAEMLDSL